VRIVHTVHRGGPLWQLLRYNISEARLHQLRRRISLRAGEPTVGVVPLLAIRTILTNHHNTLCWILVQRAAVAGLAIFEHIDGFHASQRASHASTRAYPDVAPVRYGLLV
jgi:hypothetical protein